MALTRVAWTSTRPTPCASSMSASQYQPPVDSTTARETPRSNAPAVGAFGTRARLTAGLVWPVGCDDGIALVLVDAGGPRGVPFWSDGSRSSPISETLLLEGTSWKHQALGVDLELSLSLVDSLTPN